MNTDCELYRFIYSLHFMAIWMCFIQSGSPSSSLPFFSNFLCLFRVSNCWEAYPKFLTHSTEGAQLLTLCKVPSNISFTLFQVHITHTSSIPAGNFQGKKRQKSFAPLRTWPMIWSSEARLLVLFSTWPGRLTLLHPKVAFHQLASSRNVFLLRNPATSSFRLYKRTGDAVNMAGTPAHFPVATASPKSRLGVWGILILHWRAGLNSSSSGCQRLNFVKVDVLEVKQSCLAIFSLNKYFLLWIESSMSEDELVFSVPALASFFSACVSCTGLHSWSPLPALPWPILLFFFRWVNATPEQRYCGGGATESYGEEEVFLLPV